MHEATTEAAAPAASRTPRAAQRTSVRATKTADTPKKPVEPLKRGDLQLAEFKQADWVGVASIGAQPEDFDLRPEMWLMLGDSVHAYDLVRLVARDESWWAMYLVIGAETGHANAKLLMAHELPARDAAGREKALPTGYAVRAGDPTQDRWVVIRESDGYVMNVGMQHSTFEDARRWLIDHPIFRAEKGSEYLP